MDDERLIELWYEDDYSAMDFIINYYSEWLSIIVQYVLADFATKDAIEIVLVDTYFYIWKHFDTYSIKQCSFVAWASVVAKERVRFSQQYKLELILI